MMLKRAAIISMLVVCAASGARAQDGADARPSVFSDYLSAASPGSFLRVPGLSFSSSAGFSFFSGGAGESFGMGYYMGHFGLKLSRSLSLRWDVGVGSLMSAGNEYSQPELFLPNVDLTYRPSERFVLKLEYHQYRMPGYYLMRR